MSSVLSGHDRGAQLAYAAAIGFDNLWMEDDRGFGPVFIDARLSGGQLRLAGDQRSAHLLQVSAGSNRIYQPGDFLTQSLDLRLGGPKPPGHLLAQLRPAVMISLDDPSDDIRRQQLFLQPAQDARLQRKGADPARIRASARFAVARTCPAILRDDGVGAAADAADDQTGQKMAGPFLLVERADAAFGALTLNGGEGFGIDDAKMFGDHFDPVLRAGGARYALAGFRILQHPHAAIDDAAVIGGVGEQAILAAMSADDGVGAPLLPAGCRDAFAVQRMGDRLRAVAGEIVGEDAADHGRLILDNATVAALHRAVIEQDRSGFIAIAQPAGDSSACDRPLAAPPDLVAEFLHEQRVHGAEQTDMQLADRALADGVQFDPGELEPLEDGGGVSLIAGNAIERLGNHQVEGAGGGGGKKGIQARAVMGGAGDGEIGIDLNDFKPGPIGPVATHALLIFRRAGRLQVGGEAGVNCRAGASAVHVAVRPVVNRRIQHPRPRDHRQACRQDRGSGGGSFHRPARSSTAAAMRAQAVSK